MTFASPAFCATATGTQNVSVSLGAIGKLSVVQPTVGMIHTGQTFASFTGSVGVKYEVRTTISTGNATLSVQAASDFSPSNGPSVANGDLTFTCSGASLGSNCAGTQTMSTSIKTVVSVGAGACTGAGCAGSNPNSVTVNLTLTDSPVFKTGVYSTTLTFSFSAI